MAFAYSARGSTLPTARFALLGTGTTGMLLYDQDFAMLATQTAVAGSTGKFAIFDEFGCSYCCTVASSPSTANTITKRNGTGTLEYTTTPSVTMRALTASYDRDGILFAGTTGGSEYIFRVPYRTALYSGTSSAVVNLTTLVSAGRKLYIPSRIIPTTSGFIAAGSSTTAGYITALAFGSDGTLLSSDVAINSTASSAIVDTCEDGLGGYYIASTQVTAGPVLSNKITKLDSSGAIQWFVNSNTGLPSSRVVTSITYDSVNAVLVASFTSGTSPLFVTVNVTTGAVVSTGSALTGMLSIGRIRYGSTSLYGMVEEAGSLWRIVKFNSGRTDASSESSTIAEASLGVTEYGDGGLIVGKAVSQFELSPFIDL